MSSNHASLDAAATDRKARLAKLASLKRKQPPQDDESTLVPSDSSVRDSTKDKPTPKYLSGRNYDPQTRGPKLGFENAPIEDKETLEVRAKTIADAARERDEKEKKEDKPLDLFTLQPKKPDWDLKRDLAKKLGILNQRTDNAIARIVRERVENEKRKEHETSNGHKDGRDGESVGIAGADLLETVRVREREEAEEDRREQEEEQEEEI